LPITRTDLTFELLRAFDVRQSVGMPFGEKGQADGDQGRIVFPSGCTLNITFEDSDSAMLIGRMEIVRCSIDEPFIIVLRWTLDNETQPYFMIPATLYGTNNADRGVVANHALGVGGEAKLAYRADGVDGYFSHSWHFRADHAAVPSVSATFDGRFVGLGIEEASQNPAGEWAYNAVGLWTDKDHGDSLTISMGALDWPGRIVTHMLFPGRVVEPLTKENAEGMSCRFCLYESEAADRFAYEPFIVGWYDQVHELPREGATLKQSMRDVAEMVSTDGVREESGYFHMLATIDEVRDSATLLAWAGVLQIGRPLMAVGRILDEPRYVQTAASMVDRAIVDAISPANGLFYDVFWQGKWQANNWWPDLGQTALINGHACYLLMKMYEDDNDRTSWAQAAQSVLERVLPHQRDDGRFPHGFSPEDGSPTNFDGFGGCFFAAPLLMHHRFFGNDVMRDAAVRAIEHYWQQFTRMEWIGVDLDCAGAQDSGSSYALIRALAELHQQTGEKQLLERLGHVLHYAFTYRFGHNTRHRYPVCDWSSSGSKVTSTHNVHLDAYGGEVLDSLCYYLSHVDDRYLKSRLGDSLAWAKQAYNRTEGEYGWGKVGYATEQYYHTYDTYHCHEGDGAVWAGYFPWAAGSLLNAYVVEAKCDFTSDSTGDSD
jgi:hypothetical protein